MLAMCLKDYCGLFFFSFICIVLLSFTLNLINPYTNVFEFDMKTSEILDVFICIYENQFPTAFSSTENIKQATSVLLILYCFSAVLGISLHKLVFIFGLDKSQLFKFQNNWDYVTVSNRNDNANHSIKNIWYTKIDIKSKKDELFTGKFHEIIYDKDGKIDAVSLREAYKFYELNPVEDDSKIEEIRNQIAARDINIIGHIDTPNKFVYRKRIKGNIFTIFNDEIGNISITYIQVSTERLKIFVRKFASTALLLSSLFSLINMFWDLRIFDFDGYLPRLLSCLLFPLVTVLLISFIIDIFNFNLAKNDTKLYLKKLKETFFVLTMISIPYLYTFKIVGPRTMVSLFTIWFIITVLILKSWRKEVTAN